MQTVEVTHKTRPVTIYIWWDQLPETLKTKTQLGELGLKPKGPVRAQIEYGRGRRHRIYDLYDVSEAVQKQATPAQLAALEKARIVQRTCKRCGALVERPSDLSQRGNCGACRAEIYHLRRAREVDDAILWARRLLSNPAVLILDTETTNLHGYVCEIGIIRIDGSVVYEALINPQATIEATHIHGISQAMVASAPTFADIEPELRRLLHGKTVVVYNAAYDSGVLRDEVKRLCTPSDEQMAWLVERDWCEEEYPSGYVWRWHKTIRADTFAYRMLVSEHADWWRDRVDWQCAMEEYAVVVGEPYYRGGYAYQALGGGHRAVGDCLACLGVLKEMAAAALSTEQTIEVSEVAAVETEVN